MVTKLTSAFYIIATNNYLNLDINLENILMMDNFTPVISDLALVMRTYETMNIVVGATEYVAPEILKFYTYDKFESHPYSIKTDLYAIGTLILQLANLVPLKEGQEKEYISK